MNMHERARVFVVALCAVAGVGLIATSSAGAQPTGDVTSIGVKYVAKDSKLTIKRVQQHVRIRVSGTAPATAFFPDRQTAPYTLGSVLKIWSDLGMQRKGTSIQLRLKGARYPIELGQPGVNRKGTVQMRVPLSEWNRAAPKSLRFGDPTQHLKRSTTVGTVSVQSSTTTTPCYVAAVNWTGTCVFSDGYIAPPILNYSLYAGLQASISVCWEYPSAIPITTSVGNSANWSSMDGSYTGTPTGVTYPFFATQIRSTAPGACSASSASWVSTTQPNVTVSTGDGSATAANPEFFTQYIQFVEPASVNVALQKFYVNITTDPVITPDTPYYELTVVQPAM